MSDIVVAALEAIAITSVTCIAGDAPQAAGRGCPAWLEPVQYNPMRAEEGGTAAVSLAWQLDDRAAPDNVPMKVVPHQCGPLGRFRPARPAQSGGAFG
jgi:hypothetical protein